MKPAFCTHENVYIYSLSVQIKPCLIKTLYKISLQTCLWIVHICVYLCLVLSIIIFFLISLNAVWDKTL